MPRRGLGGLCCAGRAVRESRAAGEVPYRKAIKGLDAVLAVGLGTTASAWIYDLRDASLSGLDELGIDVVAAVAHPERPEAWLVGGGALLHYKFEREAGSGVISYSLRGHYNTELGYLTCGAWLGSGRLGAAGDQGALYLIDVAELEDAARPARRRPVTASRCRSSTP